MSKGLKTRILAISKISNTLLIIAFLVLAVMLTLLAPAERSLGDFVKLIYIHAAINWTAMILFSLAGVLGLVYLVTRGSAIFSWLRALQVAAILIWIFHTFLGVISMRIIWNEFVWREPRMLFAFTVLTVAACGYLISLAARNSIVTSVVNIVIVMVIWGLLFVTGNILHPKAAIIGSPDVMLKLYVILITLSFLAAGLGLTSLVHKDTKAD